MVKCSARYHHNILDFWNFQQNGLRKFLRGWSKNDRGEFFKTKKDLIQELQVLDEQGDRGLLLEEGWREGIR